jgi:phosphatidylserine/phosphatidylglycerophosphate/cardiolipin synthase-like enzyme
MLTLVLTLALGQAPAPVAAKAWAYYSPRGGCTAAVVASIDQARASVRVLAYAFTSAPIADALVRAKARSVDVAVVLDRSQSAARGSQLARLLAAGVPVTIDSAHAIAHNKVVIVDSVRVITGSFNFSTAAEYANGENLLVLDSPALAAKYLADWSRHAAHAQPPPTARTPPR